MLLNHTILINKYFESTIFIILILFILYEVTLLFNKTLLKKIRPWVNFLEEVALKPFLLLVFELIVVVTWNYLNNHYQFNFGLHHVLFFYFINLSELIVIGWLSINLINWANRKIISWAIRRTYANLLFFIPSITTSLKCIVLLAMLEMLLPLLHLNTLVGILAEKLTHILLILSVSWILYKLILSLEKFVINKYINEMQNVSHSRKIFTQVNILKRVLIAFLAVVTFSAILMAFDSIKSIGTNILTTAGIISAIAAFASQQSLGRVFAGLQIALTQPVRIGDSVIIENEFGEVEEITLSFITIKLWDLRRLILPTDHFINKGLLNLTRESTELLGTIILYVDYTLPVQQVREKYLELLAKKPLWNKKVAQLEVTDINERAMQLRGLMSADNASDLWKLRCEIREELMSYIVNEFFSCLTKQRSISRVEKS